MNSRETQSEEICAMRCIVDLHWSVKRREERHQISSNVYLLLRESLGEALLGPLPTAEWYFHVLGG